MDEIVKTYVGKIDKGSSTIPRIQKSLIYETKSGKLYGSNLQKIKPEQIVND